MIYLRAMRKLRQCYYKLTPGYFKFTFCAVYNASTQSCAAKDYATRQRFRDDVRAECLALFVESCYFVRYLIPHILLTFYSGRT